jgi:hypothetical protein
MGSLFCFSQGCVLYERAGFFTAEIRVDEDVHSRVIEKGIELQNMF